MNTDYHAIAEILGLSKRHVQAVHRGYKEKRGCSTKPLIDNVADDLKQGVDELKTKLRRKYR